MCHSARASVYETHQNTHGMTDDKLAVVSGCHGDGVTQHPRFTFDVVAMPAGNGSQMLMEPRRLQKLREEFIKRIAVPLMCLMFPLDQAFCFVNTGLELMKHFVFY